MRLFILLVICFQVVGVAVSSSKSCIYQVKTRVVQSGGSVIIPCSYSNLEELGDDEQIGVRWLEGDEFSCVFDSDVIFPTSENTPEKYRDRLFTWKNPNRNRTQYLEITGLKMEDGPTICCNIFNKKNPRKVWRNQPGTRLLFSDKEFVTQMDELISVPGEDIVIPCLYSKKDSVQEVTWYYVQKDSQVCDPKGRKVYTWEMKHQPGQYSLENFTEDVSLRIQNINKKDEGGYCCATKKTLSRQVTKLLVSDKQNTQNPHEISVHKGGSVNLTCSYNEFRERDVLRVNVYWRAGNVTGPYAYHPYPEMVHSSYKSRTNITGVANLHIKDVQTEDNTTFHCFVVIKTCKDDNQYEDDIKYGGKTQLNVKGCTSPEECSDNTQGNNSGTGDTSTDELSPPEESAAQKGLPPYVIIIIVVIILIIIIFLILVILKVKGVLCKRKINISGQQMNTIQAAGDGSSTETRYFETSKKEPDEAPVADTDESGRKEMASGKMEDGEDDKLLYAKLDQAKLNDIKQAQRPKHSEEVVYADVLKTGSK